MRITFLLRSLDMGGGNRVVATYAQRLKSRGHDVVVVVPPTSRAASRSLLAILRSRGGVRAAPAAGVPDSHVGTAGVRLCFGAKPGVLDASDVPDGDVVVATWWETAEWAACLPASKGVRVHFIQHHEVFDYLPLPRVRAVYRLPMRRIVIAEWLKQVMAQEYGDRTCRTVPNGVDHALFTALPRKKADRPTIGFMYAPTPFKRPDLLASACSSLRRRVANLRILSFGNSPTIAHDIRVSGIEYTSNPPQDVIAKIYASCDLWLIASDSEGFGLPALEAMACRTPVVSTATGWAAEAIVPGGNGYVVPVGDGAALAARAWDVLNAEDVDWVRMSEAAFHTAKSCTWERSTDLFESALEHARTGDADAHDLGDPFTAPNTQAYC